MTNPLDEKARLDAQLAMLEALLAKAAALAKAGGK